MSSTAFVYTGPWINWSHGLISGATITLPTTEGGFLLSFLTLYVTFAGNGFWSLCAFLFHQLGAGQNARDAIYDQEQAILRNVNSELGVAWALGRVSFAWRHHRKRPHIRSLLLIFVALLARATWATAGLFASQVMKSAGSDVLIRSRQCGWWIFPGAPSYGYNLKVTNETLTAANYARQCYGSNGQNPLQCSSYVNPQLNWATNSNASCPFESGMCVFSDTAAYQMDTGHMDSNDLLGINAPHSQRITYRKVTTCAPLDNMQLQPYMMFENDTVNGLLVGHYLRLYLGPITSVSNWTYEYNTFESFMNVGYDISAVNSDLSWAAIPEFNRTDADVSLIFISANVLSYDAPVLDPVFNATLMRNFTVDNNTSYFWAASNWFNTIGCADQFQFCNPAKSGTSNETMVCTPLTSILKATENSNNIELNLYQVATIGVISVNSAFSNMYYSVNSRGSSALRAQESVYDLNSGPLPDNQWQLELVSWFSVSLARIQQQLVEYVSGTQDVSNEGGVINPPTDKYGRALCNRQKVHITGGYQNFSIVGIVSILFFGTILIVLGFTIDKIVGMIQMRCGWPYRRLVWVSDGYLQAKRMALEGAGYEGWHKCDDSYPVFGSPEGGVQQLGGLDSEDINFTKHPRIRAFEKGKEGPGSQEDIPLNDVSGNRFNREFVDSAQRLENCPLVHGYRN